MLRNSLLKFYAPSTHGRGRAMSKRLRTAGRPPSTGPWWAWRSPTSADLHVTGAALYTEDLVGRTLGHAARLAGCRPRTRTPGSPPAHRAPPTRCPAWSEC